MRHTMENPLDILLDQAFDQALDDVTNALKKEGFGVLTRIDLDAAFREKLGQEFRRFTILGACNPPLAFRAVSARPEVGLYLPCNVTVEAVGDSASRVRFLDPMEIMGQASFSEDSEMIAVATEAHERIERVASSLASKD